MNIKTGTIQFNDMLILGKAFLDSLQIKNDLNLMEATGSIKANTAIRTDFKKLMPQIDKNQRDRWHEMLEYAVDHAEIPGNTTYITISDGKL